jgi:hypothetical protein
VCRFSIGNHFLSCREEFMLDMCFHENKREWMDFLL